MKVAILFTGALRTIRKTMRYFKQNLLLNPDVDVFACIQNDTDIPNSDWEQWLNSEIGSHLKSLVWFSPQEHSGWISHRDFMLSHLNIAEHWKNYLKNSGSIIEYYQLYLAYLKMCQYEDTHYRFNYIVRARTDTIFVKPVDFHWLNWSNEQIEERILSINTQLTLSEIPITPINTLRYFMATLLSDNLIHNIKNIVAEHVPSQSFSIPETISDINNFIKNGAYILTLRANNLYICNRELFNLIPSLPYMYGFLKSPTNSPDYWFNSENQFQAACYFSGLTVFNYCTAIEDKSLYEYDEKNYFDSEFNIINPYLNFVLVRH